MNSNLNKTSSPITKSVKGKRYTATVYITEVNGNTQVYDQRDCRFRWFGYLFCFIIALDLADLVNDRVIEISTEVKPIV